MRTDLAGRRQPGTESAMRVLLVEDDDAHARLAHFLLGRAGFTVDRVATAADALRRVAEHDHDAAIVDFRLGDTSGLRLLSDLIAAGLTGPALLLTNHGSEEVAGAALRAGFDDYLPKLGGLQGDRLARAVRGMVERHRLAQALARSSEQAARLDGAVKTARLVAHQLNSQLAMLVGYGELIAQTSHGETAALAAEVLAGATDAAAVVAELQRIIRYEETDAGGGPMLDLVAATSPRSG